MSRHPDPEHSQSRSHLSRIAACVSFVTTYAVPCAVTLQEVKDATATDETLQNVAKVITTRRWHEVGNDVVQHRQKQYFLTLTVSSLDKGSPTVVHHSLMKASKCVPITLVSLIAR